MSVMNPRKRLTVEALTSRPGAHPDLELLLLCEAFCILESQINAIPGDIDASTHPLCIKQDEVADKMIELRATTMEGHIARARALVTYDPRILKPGGGDTCQLIQSALLRDLLREEIK